MKYSLLPLGALVYIAIIFLSIYVFVPLSNKDNYLQQIDECIENNFDDEYFNCTMLGYRDEEEIINRTYYGEINNEKIRYLQKGIDINSFCIIDDMKYNNNNNTKSIFDNSDNITSASELYRMYVFDDVKDEVFSKDDIAYIRKVESGYHFELSDESFLRELSTAQKKNIKILGKVTGDIKTNNNRLEDLTINIDYKDTVSGESFNVKSKLLFTFEKPQITIPGNINNYNWYIESEELVSNENFAKSIAGEKQISQVSNVDDINNANIYKLVFENEIVVADYKNIYVIDKNILELKSHIVLTTSENLIKINDGYCIISFESSSSSNGYFYKLNYNTNEKKTIYTLPSYMSIISTDYYCDNDYFCIGYYDNNYRQVNLSTYAINTVEINCNYGNTRIVYINQDKIYYKISSESNIRILGTDIQLNGKIQATFGNTIYTYLSGTIYKYVDDVLTLNFANPFSNNSSFQFDNSGNYIFYSNQIYSLSNNELFTVKNFSAPSSYLGDASIYCIINGNVIFRSDMAFSDTKYLGILSLTNLDAKPIVTKVESESFGFYENDSSVLLYIGNIYYIYDV